MSSAEVKCDRFTFELLPIKILVRLKSLFSSFSRSYVWANNSIWPKLHSVAQLICQGSHRSLKTWKVLEFENLDSRLGKCWNFCRGLESVGIWTYRSIFLIMSVQEISR